MNKIKILFLENNTENFNKIKNALNKANFSVIQSLKDTVKEIKTQKINIILINIDSIKNSYDLCKEFRKIFYNQPLQIIFITKSKDKSIVDESLEAGADDIISNPVSILEIQTRLKAAEIRYRNTLTIFKEREFYLRAAVKEEELSSKILTQNIYLKKALKKIEVINKELKVSKKHLEKIAKFDNLSGLYNRISIFNIIEMEIDRSLRFSYPVSCIMLDIDNFKSINDNYGHQFGDEVIREIGSRLKNGLRKYDSAGRYGGEEFLIVLPHTQLDYAFKITERFKESICKKYFTFLDKKLTVTASFGVAEYKKGETKEEWVNRADKGMYRAKEHGKNKIEICTK